MGIVRKRGFEPDHVGFGKHIRSEVARRPAMLVGAEIAEFANATAPANAEKRRGRGRKRHLKGSYRVKPDGNLRVAGNTRAIAVVESTVDHAAAVEFGFNGNRPKHILLKAGMFVAGRVGGEWKPDPSY